MKQFFAALMVTLVLIGCDTTGPSEQSAETAALYGEETMYTTTVSTEAELQMMHGNGPGHDSIRHGRMLGHIKMFVGLTDEQFDSVKVYAETMFLTLKDIRTKVRDSVITRDQARELVVAARLQFVASIKLILTADQLVKFEEWVTKFWNKHPRRGGHGGRGGHDGPGGPGGRP